MPAYSTKHIHSHILSCHGDRYQIKTFSPDLVFCLKKKKKSCPQFPGIFSTSHKLKARSENIFKVWSAYMNNSFLYTNVLCLILNNCCSVSQTATVSEVQKRKKWACRGFFQYTNITQETFPDIKQDKKCSRKSVSRVYGSPPWTKVMAPINC